MNEFSYLDKFLYCEFIVTFSCNNTCPYCFWAGNLKGDAFLFRSMGPWLPKNGPTKALCSLLRSVGILKYADAFRNYPLSAWQDLFARLFRGKIAYVDFTGGEPLFHYKKLTELMRTIAGVSDDVLFRIDTNGSVVPEFPPDLVGNITYNISYHKSQISTDRLLRNIEQISRQGKIRMINRVVADEHDMTEAVKDAEFFSSRGLFLNINPAFFDISAWKEENRDLLRKMIHPMDYALKIDKQTRGKKCKYPVFGFMLLPSGYGCVPPCSSRTLNVMKAGTLDGLLIGKEIRCPAPQCVCLHQYSFTEGIKRNAESFDFLDNYVKDHLIHRRCCS